ncbi:MAG TPA: hypothetical protein VMU39_03235 [Solirubrobacteraceae bacterium]|nr:hypothetical protein [Solirubrobacteraceae bacterium]
MRVLLAIIGFVLLLPVLVLVGIALGPAALMLIALAGTALVMLAIGDGFVHLARHTRVPPARR